MISWTELIGSAYSTLPSEKTTSCCVVEDCLSDMTRTPRTWWTVPVVGNPRGVLRRTPSAVSAFGQPDLETRAAAVERLGQRDAAAVRLRDGADDREPEPARSRAVARPA